MAIATFPRTTMVHVSLLVWYSLIPSAPYLTSVRSAARHVLFSMSSNMHFVFMPGSNLVEYAPNCLVFHVPTFVCGFLFLCSLRSIAFRLCFCCWMRFCSCTCLSIRLVRRFLAFCVCFCLRLCFLLASLSRTLLGSLVFFLSLFGFCPFHFVLILPLSMYFCFCSSLLFCLLRCLELGVFGAMSVPRPGCSCPCSFFSQWPMLGEGCR